MMALVKLTITPPMIPPVPENVAVLAQLKPELPPKFVEKKVELPPVLALVAEPAADLVHPPIHILNVAMATPMPQLGMVPATKGIQGKLLAEDRLKTLGPALSQFQ